MPFIVSNYAAEGGGYVNPKPKRFRTIEEARREVRRRIGPTKLWQKWLGWEDDPALVAVEAYRMHKYSGSGGVHISRDRSDLEGRA
jgi:hypothetical protein